MSCVLLCSSIVSVPERRRLCWGCQPPLWCSTMKLPEGASTGDRWQTIRPFSSKRKLARFRLRFYWMPAHCLVRLGCVCLHDCVCVFVVGLRYRGIRLALRQQEFPTRHRPALVVNQGFATSAVRLGISRTIVHRIGLFVFLDCIISVCAHVMFCIRSGAVVTSPSRRGSRVR